MHPSRQILWVALLCSTLLALSPHGDAHAQDEGLLGTYYGNLERMGEPETRIDPSIAFQWGGEGPFPEMVDNFFVRWVGELTPLYAEEYVFSARADDGMRMWIDGRLVIDQWSGNRGPVGAGAHTLNPSRTYPVLIEYLEGGGNAMIEWFWESPSQEREIVPTALLSPEDPFSSGVPVVQIHSKDTWATEGGRDKAWITVHRFGRWVDEIVVNLSYAQAGGPIFTAPATLTLEAGVSAKHFELAALNDAVAGGDGEVSVTIAPGDGYTIGESSSRVIKLLDDDRAAPELGFGIGGEIVATGVALDEPFAVGVFVAENADLPLDALTVIGPGTFSIDGLPAGEYRVAAWRDLDQDQRPDPGETWGLLGDGAESMTVALPPDSVNLRFEFSTPDEVGPETPAESPPVEEAGGCNAQGPGPFDDLLTLSFLLALFRRRRRQ